MKFLSKSLVMMAAGVVVSGIQADASLLYTLDLESRWSGGTTTYRGLPSISPAFENTRHKWVSSQNGSHEGHIYDQSNDPVNWSGSDSFNNVADLLTSVQSNPWTLYTTEAGGGTTDYFFSVNLAGVGLTAMPSITPTTPVDGSVGAPTSPTFEWTVNWNGNTGFSSPTVLLFKDTGGELSLVTSATLGSGVTSWTPSVTLDEGTQHQFQVRYTKNVTAFSSIGTPTTSGGTPFAGWSRQVTLSAVAVSQFTTVPEPAVTMGLTVAGLAAFVGWRRVSQSRR